MASKKAKSSVDPAIIHQFMKFEYTLNMIEQLVGKFNGALARFPDMNAHDLRTMIRVRLYWFFVEHLTGDLTFSKSSVTLTLAGDQDNRDDLLRQAERWVHRGLLELFQETVKNLRPDQFGKFTVRALPAFLREKQEMAGEKSLAPEVVLALREVTDHVEAETLARWLLPERKRSRTQAPIRMPAQILQFAERVCLAVQAHKEGDDIPALSDLPRAAQTLVCYFFSDVRG